MLYSNSDIEGILNATINKKSPKRILEFDNDQFIQRLEEFSILFLTDYGLDKRDPPSKVVKKLDAIRKCSGKLGALLKGADSASALVHLNAQATYYQNKFRVGSSLLNSNGKIEERDGPPGYQSILAICNAIDSLEIYVKQAIARENKKIKTSGNKSRNKGNKARQTWVNNLAGLWFDTFNELPGASINSFANMTDGPFIRFLLASHAPLCREYKGLPRLTRDAAREHYKKTGEARLKRHINRNMVKSNQKKI